MLVLILGYIWRTCLFIGLYLIICAGYTFAQTIDKNTSGQSKSSSIGIFSIPEPLWTSPILSRRSYNFYPLFQEKLSAAEFEQCQSTIIPGGILDIVNKIVYLENSNNSVIAIDLDTGKTIKQVNNICTPITIIDGSLVALSKTTHQAKSSYDLLILSSKSALHYKTQWRNPVLLPDWLDLPADGERQKFVFNVHCYHSVVSVNWQASEQAMFPDALSWIASYISKPDALQGNFSCDLKSQIIVSESMEPSQDDFLGYLTTEESAIPAAIVLDADIIAAKKCEPYLFVLVRTYPPEHNISKAGIVGKRELQVRELATGRILWTHNLPAAFIPLSF